MNKTAKLKQVEMYMMKAYAFLNISGELYKNISLDLDENILHSTKTNTDNGHTLTHFDHTYITKNGNVCFERDGCVVLQITPLFDPSHINVEDVAKLSHDKINISWETASNILDQINRQLYVYVRSGDMSDDDMELWEEELKYGFFKKLHSYNSDIIECGAKGHFTDLLDDEISYREHTPYITIVNTESVLGEIYTQSIVIELPENVEEYLEYKP